MKFQQKQRIATTLIVATLMAGCAATVPQELASARETYRRVSTGPAAESKPAEVHMAAKALDEAEQSFAEKPESYHTRDLAYVAQRKAEMAESLAETATHQASVARSDAEFMTAQTEIVKQTKADLGKSRADLAESERDTRKTSNQLAAEMQARAASERHGAATDAELAESKRTGAVTAAQLAIEQTARVAADKRAAAATLALANLAAVTEEARGLVITLSGSVLFTTDKDVLRSAAQTKLSQVADALMAEEQRPLVIEGHTDSRGSAEHNSDLSLRRANAVRSFLISKGYDANLVTAQGIGQDRPIADNTTTEGRANNRRVEIIVAPDAQVGRR